MSAIYWVHCLANDEGEMTDIGRTELIQRAIHEIRNPRRKRRLQNRFDADPVKVASRLAAKLEECDSGECDEIADFMASGATAIDPEKLKRWIEIIKILLPLILAFL